MTISTVDEKEVQETDDQQDVDDQRPSSEQDVPSEKMNGDDEEGAPPENNDASPGAARGALDLVVEAFMALGRNPLPLPLTKRIHAAKKQVIDEVATREDLRKELVGQYAPEGVDPENFDGFKEEEDAPDELIDKIVDLHNEPVSFDFGDPVDLGEHAEKVVLSDQHLTILETLNFINLTADD